MSPTSCITHRLHHVELAESSKVHNQSHLANYEQVQGATAMLLCQLRRMNRPAPDQAVHKLHDCVWGSCSQLHSAVVLRAGAQRGQPSDLLPMLLA